MLDLSTFERLVRLVAEHGALLTGFAVLVSGILTAFALGYQYFKQRIRQGAWFCPRAGSDCPGRTLSIDELNTLIDHRASMRRVADLRHHQMFGTIRALRTINIPGLVIPDPARKLIFQDMLLTRYSLVATFWDKWLLDNNDKLLAEEIDGEDLNSEMLTLVTSILDAYDTACKQQGIPSEALVSFRNWSEDSLRALLGNLSSTSHSAWVVGSTQRVGLCMSYFESAMSRTLIDGENALAHLNGSLTGKSYRGLVCGPCQ